MIREPKNVDFYTTGRHLSEEDFAKISEWINKQKSKKEAKKTVGAIPQPISVGKRKRALSDDARILDSKHY